MEAAAKIPTPIRNTKRRPSRSPSAPPTRIKAARNKPYDSTTHCTPTTLAWRPVCNAGRATLTTVPSIKAMLEPKIVAARIHRPVLGADGTAAFGDRTAPSSHGGFMRLGIDSTGVKPDYGQAFAAATNCVADCGDEIAVVRLVPVRAELRRHPPDS